MVKVKRTEPPVEKNVKLEEVEEGDDGSDADDDARADDDDDDSESDKPLKIFLKLKTEKAGEDSGSEKKEKKHKHKKKKKKKSSEEKLEKKERKRREKSAEPASKSRASGESPAKPRPSGEAPAKPRPSGESPAKPRPSVEPPTKPRPAVEPPPKPRAPSPRPAASPARAPSPPRAPSPVRVPTPPPPAPPSPPRVKVPSLLTPAQLKSVVTELVSYFQKLIQRKDTSEFFAYPVNDVIAPGYSTIIAQPMDFSTMRSKINNRRYNSVQEYKDDFILMCNNAMTYNHPDTIYYKAALKLLNFGLRQMSKDKFPMWKRTHAFMHDVTLDDLDLADDDVTVTSLLAAEPRKRGRPALYVPYQYDEHLPPKRTCMAEVEGDHLSPEEILEQAQAAAAAAKDRLSLRAPNSKLGFLRRRQDGTTTFNILNPENSGLVSDTERIVQLGSLHKLNQGTVTLPTFREDKRNIAKTIQYLDYSSFSSFAPSYDSLYANLTKDESDMLLSTYGDDVCTQYATSLQSFVGDTGESGVRFVDNLLDILTNGEHSKTKEILEERAVRRATDAENASDPVATETDSVAKETDDVAMETEEEDKDVEMIEKDDESDEKPQLAELNAAMTVEEKVLQNKLDETADLITSLQSVQYSRLSQRLTTANPVPAPPRNDEAGLADQVTRSLTNIAKTVRPGDLINSDTIHQIMGIGPTPGAQGARTGVAGAQSGVTGAQSGVQGVQPLQTQNSLNPNLAVNELFQSATNPASQPVAVSMETGVSSTSAAT